MNVATRLWANPGILAARSASKRKKMAAWRQGPLTDVTLVPAEVLE